ncbi:hypothetical protein JW872_03770 [Candidatus Babeliales bacterium]|nr:hypothetical protein [Candidatus Babeliales bacterium]
MNALPPRSARSEHEIKRSTNSGSWWAGVSGGLTVVALFILKWRCNARCAKVKNLTARSADEDPERGLRRESRCYDLKVAAEDSGSDADGEYESADERRAFPLEFPVEEEVD